MFDILRLSEGEELFTAERACVVSPQFVGNAVTSKQITELVDHGSACQVRQVEDFDAP